MLPAQVGMAACLPLGLRPWSSSACPCLHGTLASPWGSQPHPGAQLGCAGHLPPLCWGCPRPGADSTRGGCSSHVGWTRPRAVTGWRAVAPSKGTGHVSAGNGVLPVARRGGDPSGNGRGLPRRLARVVTGRATLGWAQGPALGRKQPGRALLISPLTESTGVPVHAQGTRSLAPDPETQLRKERPASAGHRVLSLKQAGPPSWHRASEWACAPPPGSCHP